MFTKSDISWLKKNLATKDDLKGLAKQKDLLAIKSDTQAIKQDTINMKLKLNDFASLALGALKNILDWTQDIYESIVIKKLPERVDKLERTVHTS